MSGDSDQGSAKRRDSGRGDDDVRRRRDERTLGPDEETLDGTEAAPDVPDGDEVPTGEVDTAREEQTMLEGATPTLAGGPTRADDEETLGGETDTAEVDVESLRVPSQTLGDDEETMVGAPETEAPTSEIDPHRAAGTLPGDFAGSTVRDKSSSQTIGDDEATVFEAGLTESLRQQSDPNATRADVAAGSRHSPHVREITPGASRGSSRTARDAAAPGYTEKGGRAAERAQPLRLEEGEDLAGRYTLKKRLGKGGMGEVWKARHRLLDGEFAIKVIKASISKDKSFRERFLKEGQTMMRVKHPGVVEVTDLDQTRVNQELFMVMQYLEGRTLYDAIRDKEKPLCDDVRNVARIYKELAEGMQRIHDERIVHKDLKSDNSLLVMGDDGLEHPKVIDFGLAKSLDDEDTQVKEGAATADGTYDPDLRTTLSGTLAYMAPEQFLGNPSSFQSDIYAFGVMLFECFNKGEYPLPRGGLAHYLQLHAEGKKPALLAEKRPDLPTALVELSDRCMAPRKADRPESFREVADALQWWLDEPERRAKARQRNMMIAAALLLICIAIAGWVLAPSGASVGEMTATVNDRQVKAEGGVVHLSERGLGALQVGGPLTGSPEDPWVEIDGDRVDAEIREDLGNLVAVIDGSGLSEGPHDVVLMAAPGAGPGKLRIAVDRTPPAFDGISVSGKPDGGYVAAPAPEVRVRLGESTIASVTATVDGASGGAVPGSATAGEDGPRDEWSIFKTTEVDGPVSMEIEARDYAGNVSRKRFSYVRDTQLLPFTVADLRPDGVLRVRDGLAAKLRVTLGEAGTVELSAPGAAPQKRDAASPGVQEFDLPPVPGEGYDVTLTVADIAGNARKVAARVEQWADQLSVKTLDGGTAPMSVKGDKDLTLRLERTYALDRAATAVMGVRVRDAQGNALQGAPEELEVTFTNATDSSSEFVIAARSLAEGTWRLSAAPQGRAEVRALEVTVDRTQPVVHGVVVRDANGAVVAGDAWCLTRSVSLEVDAEDLDLSTLTVEGFTGPVPALAPGRRTYRFERTFPSDGDYQFGIAATDSAKNTNTTQQTVRCDATDPTITLTSPQAGDSLNDKESVTFAGRCSEPDYDLFVVGERVSGGSNVSRHAGVAFSADVRLTFGTGVVSVYAVDRAKRRSPTVTVSVDVKQLETELPDTIEWTRGPITARMEKVREGDVVIKDRAFPVTYSFIDHREVTNAEYRAFLAAAATSGDSAWRHPDQPEGWDHTPPSETWDDPTWGADERPVVNVAWWDAYAFARWSGRRLPTEAEWVKAAAKKEGEPDLLRWPTGNEWRDGTIATSELVSTLAFQGPVNATTGSDISPSKCLHMGGNVSEWVRLERVPEGEPDTAVRGGNWYLSRVAADVRTVPAKRYDPSVRAATIGFRCAVDAEVVRAEAPGR